MVRHRTSWEARSSISRSAHVLERIGLALTGASCALFVVAYVGRSEIVLILSTTSVLSAVVYGAIGFYLGIDLPHVPPDHRMHLPLRSNWGTRADAVELLSAAGTFLAAVAAIVSVSNIILDDAADAAVAILIWLAWAAGATMQIAAGIVARRKVSQSEKI
jgi:hypothetical protein